MADKFLRCRRNVGAHIKKLVHEAFIKPGWVDIVVTYRLFETRPRFLRLQRD
jgi:hypothetical protein